MATQVQHRRGNTVQTNAFTGAIAEITVDTDKNTIVVHDGSTLGGTPLAKESNVTSSFIQANAAFIKANNEAGVNDTQNTNITTATTIATGAFVQANSGFDKANSANVLAQQAFDAANNAFVQGGQIAFAQANAAFDKANNEAGVNVTQNTNITNATNIATGAFVQANSAFNKANNEAGVNETQNTNITNATTIATGAFVQANAAFNKANNEAGVNATQNTNITNATTIATGAFVQANAAFIRANNSLNVNVGGTIDGDLTITGNLSVIGNTVSYDVNTYVVNDPIIILANNNFTDTLDIGFAAHYSKNSVDQLHTGLVRHAATDKYYLFEDYEPHLLDDNILDINDASLKISTLTANIEAGFVTVGGINLKTYSDTIFVQANSAFDKANNEAGVNNTQNTNITNATNIATGAFNQANASFNKANNEAGVNNTQNTNITTATNIATGAFNAANNEAGVNATQNTNITNATNIATGAFVKANNEGLVNNTQNTNITTATNIATGAFVQANAAFATANNEAGVNATQNTNITNATNIATGAFNKANAAVQQAFVTVAANGTNLVADSNTDTLTITAAVANGISIIGNATTDTLDIGLRPSGVSSGVYGSASVIPVVTFDTFGRATSAANLSVSISTTQVTSGTLPIARGGTNQTTYTNNQIVYFDGTSLTSLANTGTAGTYANASHIPVITTDAFGRVSSVSNVHISIDASRVTSGTLPIARGGTNGSSFTNNQITYFNGTSVVSLANTGTAGTYANASHVPVITTDGFGRVSGVSNTPIAIAASQVTSGTLPIARGGTNQTTYTNNQIVYFDGSSLRSLANSGVTAGTYGGGANNAIITVDEFGRVTAAANVAGGGGGDTDFAYFMASSVLSGI
jgi:hypothetical protein